MKKTYILGFWIKRFFCKHQFAWFRNIYGDEIIHCGYNRSEWRCSKCGAVAYNDKLNHSKEAIELEKKIFENDHCTCPDFGYYMINGSVICSRCNRSKLKGYTPNPHIYKQIPFTETKEAEPKKIQNDSQVE